MIIKLLPLCCLLLLMFCVGDVYACSCAQPGPPCNAANEASAVFVGTVISSQKAKTADQNEFGSREVKFAIEETFAGVRTNEVSLFTGWGGGDCGFGFQIGRQYLVYAYKGSNSERISTSICTRTRSLTDASEDLAYLRNASNSTSGPLILGSVQRFKRGVDGNSTSAPMTNVKIIVESGDKTSDVVTDREGNFVVKGLKPGTHKVLIDLAKGLTAGTNEQTVTLSDKGCASIYFGVESDGRLIGLVKTQLGVPVEKAEIFIFPEDKKKYQGYWDAAYTDKDGVYTFKRIPPGKYKLQIRFDGLTSQTRPFPNIYHPGVSDSFQAKVIEIGDGEEVKDYDLIVPELPNERTIEGTVVAPDGSVIKDAKVGYAADAVTYGATMDSPGHFSLRVYEGVSVSLNAYVERDGKRMRSQWITIPANGDPGKLKLIIQGY